MHRSTGRTPDASPSAHGRSSPATGLAARIQHEIDTDVFIDNTRAYANRVATPSKLDQAREDLSKCDLSSDLRSGTDSPWSQISSSRKLCATG